LGYLAADFFNLLDLSLTLDDVGVFFLATARSARRAIPIRLPRKHVPEEVDGRKNKRNKDF
jgi:hypothetical protein